MTHPQWQHNFCLQVNLTLDPVDLGMIASLAHNWCIRLQAILDLTDQGYISWHFMSYQHWITICRAHFVRFFVSLGCRYTIIIDIYSLQKSSSVIKLESLWIMDIN